MPLTAHKSRIQLGRLEEPRNATTTASAVGSYPTYASSSQVLSVAMVVTLKPASTHALHVQLPMPVGQYAAAHMCINRVDIATSYVAGVSCGATSRSVRKFAARAAATTEPTKTSTATAKRIVGSQVITAHAASSG